MKNQNGYTIIELLAVMLILVIVTSVITGMLAAMLRTTSKADIVNIVTQNGNYALSVMTDDILAAKKVESIDGSQPLQNCLASPVGQSITLDNLDGSTVSFTCAGNTIDKQICDPTDNCDPSTSLINTSQIQIVQPLSIKTCKFVCLQTSSFAAPLIQVNFSLTATNQSLLERESTQAFNTAVTLRNFSN